MVNRIKEAIEETVENVKEEIKSELNEEVGTVTFQRWEIALIAASVTALILIVVLS